MSEITAVIVEHIESVQIESVEIGAQGPPGPAGPAGPPGVSTGDSIAEHEAAPDPHPMYLTPAEANALYAVLGHDHADAYEVSGAVATHEAGTGVHPLAGVTGLSDALDGKAATSHDHATVYAPLADGVTGGNSHAHASGDGAPIFYGGLSGLPTLGSAAATAASDYATAAQGSTADSALQPGEALVSDPTGITGASALTNLVSLTQAAYDALVTPSASTLYIVTDA